MSTFASFPSFPSFQFFSFREACSPGDEDVDWPRQQLLLLMQHLQTSQRQPEAGRHFSFSIFHFHYSVIFFRGQQENWRSGPASVEKPKRRNEEEIGKRKRREAGLPVAPSFNKTDVC